jgi:hypothetical protein
MFYLAECMVQAFSLVVESYSSGRKVFYFDLNLMFVTVIIKYPICLARVT